MSDKSKDLLPNFAPIDPASVRGVPSPTKEGNASTIAFPVGPPEPVLTGKAPRPLQRGGVPNGR